MLIYHVMPSGKCLISNGLISQHDSDPRHTATAVNVHLNGPNIEKHRMSFKKTGELF